MVSSDTWPEGNQGLDETMKRLLFASLVAVAATTLQAVNYDWTNVNTNGNATGQVTLDTGLSHTQGFAVSLTINVTAVPETMNNNNWWPALLSLGKSDDGDANITANMTETDGIRLDTKSGKTGSTKTCVKSNTKLTTGKHTVVLAYDGTNMTLTLDGTELAKTAYTLTYDPNTVAWGQQAGWPNLSYLNNGGQFEYTIESLQVGRVQEQTVPEPTVLALLALGVAGVALRRRVA